MALFKYRLQPLLDQKEERKKDAAEKLAESRRQLAAEQQRLEELKLQVEQLKQKREALRGAMLTGAPGSLLTGAEVRQRVDHVHTVGGELESAKDAVFSQGIAIEEAEDRVNEAQQHLVDASREVDILTKHRDKSERRFLREIEIKEELEQDETGTTMFLNRRRSS